MEYSVFHFYLSKLGRIISIIDRNKLKIGCICFLLRNPSTIEKQKKDQPIKTASF